MRFTHRRYYVCNIIPIIPTNITYTLQHNFFIVQYALLVQDGLHWLVKIVRSTLISIIVTTSETDPWSINFYLRILRFPWNIDEYRYFTQIFESWAPALKVGAYVYNCKILI